MCVCGSGLLCVGLLLWENDSFYYYGKIWKMTSPQLILIFMQILKDASECIAFHVG